METPLTVTSRKDIGFPADPRVWRDSPATFTDHTLRILGHPVMEDWERGYMRDLAEVATSRGGDVLELGFGMGISASFVQQGQINSHVVIEANCDVHSKLVAFAAQHSRVRPVLGFWEDVCPNLPDGSFDGILFDTYPLREEEVHCNHFPFFEHAYRLLRSGGVLTYYSDEALEFSQPHLQKLREAGFQNIVHRLCTVLPPEGCEYWQGRTLLVPIIIKH